MAPFTKSAEPEKLKSAGPAKGLFSTVGGFGDTGP